MALVMAESLNSNLQIRRYLGFLVILNLKQFSVIYILFVKVRTHILIKHVMFVNIKSIQTCKEFLEQFI